MSHCDRNSTTRWQKRPVFSGGAAKRCATNLFLSLLSERTAQSFSSKGQSWELWAEEYTFADNVEIEETI